MQSEKEDQLAPSPDDVNSDSVVEGAATRKTSDAKSDQDQDLDDQHRVFKKLLVAHETWFDVTYDYRYAGRTFPGYAEFHSHGEKYVLVKRAKLWEVDAHEYIFFDFADTLTAEQMQTWIDFMKSEAFEKVEIKPNHMTSYLSLVLVANSVDDQAARLIRKTRFHKELKMGLAGWVDMRLAAIDVTNRQIYTNSMGKEMVDQLRSALGLPAKKKLFRR